MNYIEKIEKNGFYKSTPVLETDRLILRPLTENDAQSVFSWASDERVNRFMRYSLYQSIDEAFEWLNEIIPSGNEFNWGFVLKKNNILIGTGGIGPDAKEKDAWGFGYNIAFDYWNQGYTTEATKKMIEFAHNECGVNKIVAEHAIDNIASGRVIEKCGLKYYADSEYTTFDGTRIFKSKRYRLEFE